MARDDYASLNEDLTEAPMHAAAGETIKRLLGEGHAPREIIDAVFATATAFMIDVEGLARTSLHLLKVGSTLASASPEMAAIAKANLEGIKRAEVALNTQDGRPTPRTRTDH